MNNYPAGKRLSVALALCVACDAGESGESGAATSTAGTSGDPTGGDEATGVDETAAPAQIDVDAIMEEAANYASYVKINAEPKASEHQLGVTVNVWVGADVAQAYGSIDPDKGSSEVVFPPGSYLFKEHLNGADEFNGLTIMVKGPPGYDSAAADWWWGRTTAAGELADQGAVGFCIDCHTRRSKSDFVFGVPTDNRQ